MKVQSLTPYTPDCSAGIEGWGKPRLYDVDNGQSDVPIQRRAREFDALPSPARPSSAPVASNASDRIAGDAIADLFIDRILAGSPSPGSRLTEREIAAVADCTHARAREALHHLEKAGAVRIFRHRGAVVLSAEDAPPEEIDATWSRLLTLLETLAKAPFPAIDATMTPSARLAWETAQLDRLGGLAGDAKLADLLKRLALHRAIVATGVA